MILSRHTNQLLMTALLLAATWMTALAGNLPDGRLVKIGVDHTGVFQITARQLADMGFASADEVAVYGYGGVTGLNFDFNAPCPDGLPEIPTMVTDDGRVIFFAEGPERYSLTSKTSGFVYTTIENNPTTTRGYYFVGAKSAPRRVATSTATTADGNPLTTHYATAVYHPQTTNPAHAGAVFLGDDFSKSPDKTIEIPFATTGIKPSTWIGLRLRGGIKARTPRITYRILSSDKALNASPSTSNYNDIQIYFGSTKYAESTYQLPASSPDEITLTANVQRAGDVSYAAIESATLTFTRYNAMPDDGSPLSMYFFDLQEGSPIAIEKAGGTRLWDVTDGLNPIQLATETGSDESLTAIAPTNRPGSANIIAFNPDGSLDQVEIVGETTLAGLSTMTVPQMVIITAPGLRQQAERLADIHRHHDGMTVAVVEPEEIFNEFGSGSQSPYAIRRFMKSLYDRDGKTLRHLLLFGSSTYDPCGRTGSDSTGDTRILTYQTEEFLEQGDAAKCYGTDAFYGFLEDNDTPANIVSAKMSINVSRIPAVSTAQAIAYVSKVERYLDNPPVIDAHSQALVIADYGDDNGHLKQAGELSDMIENEWTSATTVTRAMAALYAPGTASGSPLLDKVLSTINNGVGYIAYSGHGNPSSIGSDEFLKRPAVSSLSNTIYPFVMLSTCYTTAFDRNENGIGEVFLLNGDGGAIALVGAGRSVVMAYNQYLNIALAREYFKPTQSNCLGDIFRVARNSMLSSYTMRELAINTAGYNFIGDPALPLYGHTHTVKTDVSDMTITPLTLNPVKGQVTDADGTLATDFNGTVILNLYCPDKTDYTIYDKKGCEPLPVKRRETVAATATGRVSGGRFEVQLDCPAVSEPGGNYKLTVHTISDDGTSRAVTAVNDVTVDEAPDNSELDGTPPVISSMWLNSPEFTDGDVLGPEVTVYATITPSPSGLSLTQAIGRIIYLELDGKRYNDIAGRLTFDKNGVASLQYRLTGLTDGPHSLTLSAVDNAGNRSESTIQFQVVTSIDDVTLLIDETTAETQATINLVSDRGVEGISGRLIIEDASGRTVFSQDSTSFPFAWNLKDGDGNQVPDGRYTARAMLKKGVRYSTTPTVTFVVIK